MPYVSVIIPCYNTASYIEKCLRGLEEQSYRDFDVILVDDCSTDNTAEVIREYAKGSNLRLQYYQNEENVGPSATRKKGIEFSNAKYIAFCDNDDWYEPDYLELMVQQADENDADMVFCGYQTVSVKKGEKVVTPHSLGNIPSERSTKNMISFAVDSLCVTLIKREIVASISFPNLRNGEDMAIIPIMIANSQSFGVVNKCLYNYLYRENSASLTANEKVVESLIQSFEHIEVNMPEEYRNECEIIGVRNLLYGGLLALFKYSYDRNKAREILSQFEKKYPEWKRNIGIEYLPFYKRVFLKLAGMRCFLVLKVLAMIHILLTRN